MNPYQQLVQDFHVACQIPVGDYSSPKVARPELRVRLIDEEATETETAINLRNMVGAADGLCDTIYVTFGAAVEAGLVLCEPCKPYKLDLSATPRFAKAEQMRDELYLASRRACMALLSDGLDSVKHTLGKLVSCCYDVAAVFSIDLEPLYREVHRANVTKAGGPKRADGKILKPAGWQPPQIKRLLEEQGWREAA